ncbi:hypothetical protein BH10PSE3_BH10PSE3_01640 [soil metagenome]
MTTRILTVDTVRAEDLDRYVRQDWTATPGLVGGWSVAFGPVTQVLFLQSAGAGDGGQGPASAAAGFALERRERHWLQEMSPFGPGGDGISVFELRTYDVRVGQGEEFLKLMLAALPIRQRHSANFGVWRSLSGRLEQVRHLWGYRDLAQRTAVRGQLKDDVVWGDYTRTILPMLETLQSTILTPLPLSAARQ